MPQAMELRMENLRMVKSLLEKRGVLDVKMYFHHGVRGFPPSDVMNSTCDFLDAYLHGRYKTVEKLHDAPIT